MNINIESKDIGYFRDKIIDYGNDNFDKLPWRLTNNKWHALTAEFMLRRTKAEQVLPVYEQFCSIYEKPDDYLINSKGSNPFTSLGLPNRENEFNALVEILVCIGIPEEKEELLRLPGVGEYIASAFRSFHLGKREFIIDSNVVRFYGRYFGFKTDGETRRKKWFIELANKLTPQTNFKEFNYGLLDFTRKVCRPKPDCLACLISKKCNYNITNEL